MLCVAIAAVALHHAAARAHKKTQAQQDTGTASAHVGAPALAYKMELQPAVLEVRSYSYSTSTPPWRS